MKSIKQCYELDSYIISTARIVTKCKMVDTSVNVSLSNNIIRNNMPCGLAKPQTFHGLPCGTVAFCKTEIQLIPWEEV
jgi:hypothetical protein